MKIKLLYNTIFLLCLSVTALPGTYSGIVKIDSTGKEKSKQVRKAEKQEEPEATELSPITHFCTLKI